MSIYAQSRLNNFPHKLIGEILQEAGLISSPQLKIALDVQNKEKHFKLGEILVSKGWLSQKTVNFLVDVFSLSNLNKYLHQQPIGYYLKEAGLLTSEQINSIINDQKEIGVKFCYLAVIKGFLQPKTADFFLDYVAKKFSVTSTSINSSIYHQDDSLQTIIVEDNDTEEILSNNYTKKIDNDRDLTIIDDSDIQSSSIWIDFNVPS